LHCDAFTAEQLDNFGVSNVLVVVGVDEFQQIRCLRIKILKQQGCVIHVANQMSKLFFIQHSVTICVAV